MGRKWVHSWLGEYRSALGQPDLRRLFTGTLVSQTGTWAYNVALLAFVFQRTHSLGWVSAAGIARFIPSLLLSAYGGVLAERVERIGLMVRADLVCAALQIGLTVDAAVTGPAWLALALAALCSGASVVYPPATAATIPSLVTEGELTAANALNGTIEQLVVIAGPAVGAVLLLIGSPAFVFGVNAASFVGSALLVRRITTRSRPVDVSEEGTAGPLAQMRVGISTIMGLSAARTLVAFCALVSFVYGTDTVLFVGVSEHYLGTGSEGFGYLLAGLGVGGVLAAGAVNKLAGARRLSAVILAGAVGYSLPTVLLVFVRSPELAFAIEVFRGAATLVVDVLAVTALQRAVAGDQLARVFGVFFAFVISAIALGTLLTPIAISVTDLNGGLWVMAVGPALLALAGYPALLAIDRETAARAAQLEPRVALLEGLGIFAAASRPILERLAGVATEVRFTPGQVIVAEGDVADALYVLATGEVSVTARGEAGGAVRDIRVMTAPAYFGEIGVLEQIPRTATVTADGPVAALRIDGEALIEALSTSPPSSSLMENARGRLATTHPMRAIFFGAESAIGPEKPGVS